MSSATIAAPHPSAKERTVGSNPLSPDADTDGCSRGDRDHLARDRPRGPEPNPVRILDRVDAYRHSHGDNDAQQDPRRRYERPRTHRSRGTACHSPHAIRGCGDLKRCALGSCGCSVIPAK
jgi:hypothetical protein